MKKKQSYIFPVFFILLPAILFLIITIVQCGRSGVGLSLPMPKWNDEAAYYELIKTWLATGMPEGYWGFGGGHAIIGTGSAWSPAILLPYAVWGEMFGWTYGSVVAANVAFLCIANAVVLLLCRPDKQGVWGLVLLEMFSGHILLYMNTVMSEVLRYALAIVLAAMLYRLLFGEEERENRIFRYIIVPAYIIVVTQIYIFFAFAVPIYVFAVCRRKKWYWRTILAFLAMAVEAGGSYYLLHLISSNYNIYKTEMLFKALEDRDIFGAVRTFLWMFRAGLIDLWNCFLSYTGYGMFRWFVPLLGVFVCLPLLVLCGDGAKYLKNRKEAQNAFWNSDRQILLIVCYSVLLFVTMYITVYSLEAFTLYRGVGIVLLFSMVLLLRMERKKWGCLFLALYATGILFVPKNQTDFNGERYPGAETVESWTKLAEELAEAMPLQTEDSGAEMGEEELRWANTAVLYTMEPKLICAMPAGMGVNFAMYSDEIVEEAGYLVFSLEERENLRPDWLEQSHRDIYEKYGKVLEDRYFIQYADDEYIIYKKAGDDKPISEIADPDIVDRNISV